MHIRRGFLFWGSFFVLLGAIPLVVREADVDLGRFSTADAVWPVALIAVGILVLFSRSRLNVLAILAAGVLLGAVCGTALAYGGAGFLDAVGCGNTNSDNLQQANHSGTFGSDASMDLTVNCGNLQIRPVAGNEWALNVGYRGGPPSVDASASSLDARSPDGLLQHQEWSVALPTAAVHQLTVQMNAGSLSVNLAGAALRELDIESNAGDVLVQAGDAPISDLQLQVNAGRARVTLGGPVNDGNLQANAGSIDLCVPASATLSFDVADHLAFDTNLGRSGFTREGSTWSRPGTGGPVIQLSVEGNAASFNVNPAGGCE